MGYFIFLRSNVLHCCTRKKSISKSLFFLQYAFIENSGTFFIGEKKQVGKPVFLRNFNKCLKTLKLKHLKLDLILAVFASFASGNCDK